MKKIYSCMLAMAMTALAANATDYYLIGGFNGWALADAKCLFTEAGNGVYELDYEGTLSSGFKINDGTWANPDANFGGSSVLTLGETYSLEVGGSSENITLTENVKNPHLVFNPAEKTLVVTGKASAAEYVYMLHGNWDGGTAWTDLKLTESNGNWTATGVTVEECNFGIKKADKGTGAQVDWIASADAADVTVGQAMACVVNGSNFALAAGNYDFAFDAEAMTLTVSVAGQGGGEDPDPVPANTWNVHGSIFGGTGWTSKVMTLTNGKWVLADVEVLAGDFGLRELDKAGEQITWAASTGDGVVVLDEAMAVGTVGVKNFSIKAGTYTFTFDPAAMTLFVTGKVGEEVEDVLTYYIKGDIFGDPLWSSEAMTEGAGGNWTLSKEVTVDGQFGVMASNQFGQQRAWYAAAEADVAISLGTAYTLIENGSNMSLGKGNYTFTFNPETLVLTVTANSVDGVAEIGVAEGEAEYFNLQGARVENPAAGIYVKVLNGKATKVVVK
ncbi:MAG: hypothetical protein K2I37_03880 [Muribaculaceae bacterium]|nr:hypothetical protein [Muribaculaceae bacterium]